MGECLHLVLNLLEDGGGSRRHAVEVLDVHLVELVADVLLDRLYEVVQVLHVVHRTLALPRGVRLVLHVVINGLLNR